MYQVGYFLIRNATCYPNRAAVVADSCALTYRELNERANRLANSLTDLGIRQGDRIAVLMRNSVEWMVTFCATQKVGAAVVPVNSRLLQHEVVRMVDASDSCAFVYGESLADKAQAIKDSCKKLRWVIGCGEALDLADLIRNGRSDEAQVPLSEDDESLLLFTSGTTGAPKGVLRTQRAARNYGFISAIQNNNCTVPEVMLTHCPLFHMGGITCVLKMLALCGTLILHDGVDPRTVLENIEKYRVTQVFMVPPVLYGRLIRYENWRSYDLSSVKLALYSGGCASMKHVDEMFTLFPNAQIRASYGSTETFAVTSVVFSRVDLVHTPDVYKSIGYLNTAIELRLVDEQGNDVDDGIIGEALVRSSLVFDKYLDNPEATHKVKQADGWFHTEDMLRKDTNGLYYLVDRKRDMVKTGGENVYAQEVEGVLKDHPVIFDCAVIGVPDATFGEAIAAALVLNEGCALDSREFVAYCKTNMSSYKKPRYWAILDSLPTNSVGKLQKSVLRENAEQLFTEVIQEAK